MRIHDVYRNTPTPSTATGTVRTPSAEGSAAGTRGTDPAEPSVKVSISTRARELVSRPESGVDEAKVARLKEQLERGTLAVDSSAIARKIVDED